METSKLLKKGLIFVITTLFITSSFMQMTMGSNVGSLYMESVVGNNFSCYDISEISDNKQHDFREYSNNDIRSTVANGGKLTIIKDGLMDSPWPMYCHDRRHTGRSPYYTNDTWDEIWKFETRGPVEGGPVIAEDGTIYAGAYSLYAVFPNGTKKWENDLYGWIESCPAIDENGTVYVGSIGGGQNYMFAINSDGTIKWKYPTSDIYSSPAIDDDGNIYFGDSENKKIKALYPNGTLKWSFQTNHVVYSSPAIGNNGTLYCGSHDTYLYALFLNNGTLKWKFKTGNWIRTSPSIADDGTIYVVSLDNHLYAIFPNGTLKWKTNMGEAGTSPTIGWDGTIYAGYKSLRALNPMNGSLKWKFKVSGAMRGGTPCNSIDGTIYVGTHIGSFDDGEIIAIYPDGSLKFRKRIRTVESPPAIDSNGTVYIGSHGGDTKGYLHAFSLGELKADANGPHYGLINESIQFSGSASGGYRPYTYHWDFGDDNTSNEQNPTHIYSKSGNYTVTLTVTDNKSNTTDDVTWAWIQESNDPPNNPSITGETEGKAGTKYNYTFLTNDPEGAIIWYYIEWGDGTNTGWLGPYSSGEEFTKSHSWSKRDTYIIRCKAKDPYGAVSGWGELKVTMPKNQHTTNNLILRFFKGHPHAFPILKSL